MLTLHQLRSYKWSFVMVVVLLLLNGCGSSTNTNTSTKTAITVHIVWPDRTRVIPALANSIVCSIQLNGKTVQTIIAVRPSGSNKSDIKFVGLTPGNYNVVAYASPNMDGTGITMAEGSTSVIVTAGNISTFSISMLSTITSVGITGDIPFAMNIGDSVTLTASATNGDSNLVLVDPSEYSWTGTTGVVSVPANGSSISAKIVGSGNGTITVKEQSSGRTASMQVYGFAASTKTNWSVKVGNFNFVAPTLAPDGSIIVNLVNFSSNSLDNSVACVEASSGKIRWTVPVTRPVFAHAIFDESGNVLVGGSANAGLPYANPTVYSINLATGGVNYTATPWIAAIDRPVGMIYATHRIYVALDGSTQNIFALNSSDGSVIWSDSIPGTSAVVPAYDSSTDTLFAASSAAEIRSYKASTGSLNWRQNDSNIAACFVDDAFRPIYITNEFNTVYTVDKATGAKRTDLGQFRDRCNTARMGPNSTIYVGTIYGTYVMDPVHNNSYLIVGSNVLNFEVTPGPNLYTIDENGFSAFLAGSKTPTWQFPPARQGIAVDSSGNTYLAASNYLFSIHN